MTEGRARFLAQEDAMAKTLVAEIERLDVELDALRAFVERIARLDPKRGPVDVHTMVEDAKRLLRTGHGGGSA
jgi:uncharacterized protein (UPF0335 family)